MDLMAIYETNFTIFIGIFVTLAVMGTTTLYDKHRSKSGTSFDFKEFEFFSGMTRKITAFSSGGLKQLSEYSKKFGGSTRKKSSSGQRKSCPARKNSSPIQSSSNKNSPGKVEIILLNVKNALQMLSVNFRNKISSLSSALPHRNNDDKGELAPLSGHEKFDSKLSVSEKVNNLDKVVESKKDELDFDDDLLTKMSTAGNFTGNGPEVRAAASSFGETSLEIDASFENDLKFDENEFAIKVDGLDNESSEENFTFNEDSAEIKFGEDSDNLLDSLKKEIVITQEKKINFMDNMQGEDLDLKLMKSDLEGILKDLKRYRQFTNH